MKRKKGRSQSVTDARRRTLRNNVASVLRARARVGRDGRRAVLRRVRRLLQYDMLRQRQLRLHAQGRQALCAVPADAGRRLPGVGRLGLPRVGEVHGEIRDVHRDQVLQGRRLCLLPQAAGRLRAVPSHRLTQRLQRHGRVALPRLAAVLRAVPGVDRLALLRGQALHLLPEASALCAVHAPRRASPAGTATAR